MVAVMKKQEGPEFNISGPSATNETIIRDYWEWSYLGLCKHPSIAKFFGLKSKINQAKAWCDICPVREDCLLWAVIYNESGVWGGKTDTERSKEFSQKDREELIKQAKLQGNYYVRETPGASIQQFRKQSEGQSKE